MTIEPIIIALRIWFLLSLVAALVLGRIIEHGQHDEERPPC